MVDDRRWVGIDGRSLRAGPAGVATYVQNLLRHIPFLDCLEASFPANNFLWNQLRVPLAGLRRGWKLYHAPGYTAPLIKLCPLVLSVHDVSYLAREEWYPYRLDSRRLRYYRASMERADRILVPSDFSRFEVERLLPGLAPRLRRVYLGVSEFFRKDEDAARLVRTRYGLPGEFILHVGDIHPRRNIPLLAEAARRASLSLVLVGRFLRGGARFRNWPYLYSNLSETDLRGFYSAATVFVYPSLYEGFGLPVLEAMACELPVLATHSSCLPEICGGGALIVEPELEPLVEGIRTLLDRRSEFVQRGLARSCQFSWKRTADETVAVYRELAH